MHSFGFYLKKGFALTKLMFRKRSFLDKLILALYFIGSLVGKLVFFLRPAFLIGDQNIALMLNEGHDVEVSKIFEGVNDKKRYTSLLLSSLFIDAIVIGLAVVLVVPFVVGSFTSDLVSVTVSMSIIYEVSAVVVGVLYVALLYIYSPMGFVTAKGVDLSAGDVLFLARKASKGNVGKFILLGIICYLPIYVSLGAIIGLAFVFLILAVNATELFVIGAVVMLILIPVLEVFVFARLKVAYETAFYAICSDSVIVKHVVLAKRNTTSFEEYVGVFSDDQIEDK